MRHVKHVRRLAVVSAGAVAGLVLLAHIGGWQALLAPAVIAAPLVASFNMVGQCAVNGVMLLFSPPFEIGDTLTIEGQTGVVVSIGLLHTWLTGADGERLPVPNAKFSSDIYSIQGKEKPCSD